ncbi:MAG TPA: rhodanese-like domain-containing protein [Saprospirales bacterium]|nr:rhodanese-like domain-containing protein [Saprospirales bacterium]
MEQLRFLFIFLVCFITSISCFSQVESGAYRIMLKGLLSHSVPEITVQEAKNKQSQSIFLDAREPREYEISHISGATSVGYDHFDLSKISLPADKSKPIIVYCSVGYRSEKVAEKLIKAGYQNVSNMYGGIFEWVNSDYPVVNSTGPTRRVHAFDRTWGVWLNKGEKVYK